MTLSLRLALVFALLPGCATVNKVLNSAFQNPKVSFRQMNVRNVSFQDITMDFEFMVENPNDLSLSLASLAYDLRLEDKKLASGTTKQGVSLPARGSAPVQLPLTITFTDFVDNLALFFSSKQEVPYSIDTSFGFDTMVGEVKLPLRQSGQVPLPKPPEVQVADARFANVSLLGARMEVALDVANRSTFPVRPEGFAYSISVAGVPVSRGQENLPVLTAGARQRIVLPIELSFASLGAAVVEAIRSKRVDYAVQGSVNLGLFQQPFNLSGTANL